MNHYFYELQAREQLAQFRAEGQLSQALRRGRPSRPVSRFLGRFIAIAVSVLALILVWAR